MDIAALEMEVTDVNGNVIENWMELILTEAPRGVKLKKNDKIKNVRLIDWDPDNIEWKIDGVSWVIKTMYVKVNAKKNKKKKKK